MAEAPKKVIAFDYKALRPDENGPEYQFEEIRARIYIQRMRIQDEVRQKVEQELKNKYECEINELKRKLAEANSETKRSALKNRISMGYNNTNLTNVTQFDVGSPEDYHEETQSGDSFRFKDIPVATATGADATSMDFYNKTITAKTNELRKNFCNMYNNTLTERVRLDESNWITHADINPSMLHSPDNVSCINNQTTTMPTIPIYKDNPTFSIKPGDDQSQIMIFSDAPPAGPLVDEPQKPKRQPLATLEDNEQILNARDELTEICASTSDSPFSSTAKIDFEPPSASTSNIRPLLNKMRQARMAPCSELDSFLIEENENSDERRMSNILAQDFPTAAVITSTQCPANTDKHETSQQHKVIETTTKITKQVKFGHTVVNESNIHHSINATPITTRRIDQLNWDDFGLEEIQGSNHIMTPSNITEQQKSFNISDFQLTKREEHTSPSQPIFDLPDCDDQDLELTSNKWNESFNKDYYKLCAGGSTNTTISVTKNLQAVNNLFKLREEAEYESNEIEVELEKPDKSHQMLNKTPAPIVIANETHTNITVTKTVFTNKTVNQDVSTMFNDTSIAISDLSDIDTTIGGNTTTTGSSKLNDTVAFSIREPFKYEFKNRLLQRGAINELKKNPNYVELKSIQPTVNVKRLFQFKSNCYNVLAEIGKGAFANIYRIENVTGKGKTLALKVDKQPTAWEFYITESIHQRLKKMQANGELLINVTSSFVRMHEFIKYENGCVSIMDYYKNGSLLDLINYHVTVNESFPYWFVLYLTLELLNILEYLHKCHIIHADIKPDNMLINQLPGSLDYFEPARTKCLVLIDYNRSIDLNMLPDDSEFNAKTDNKSLLCVEMKSDRPWRYQIDYYGIISSIHGIIFKKYMNTYQENGRNKISSSIPRSYDRVFAKMFDTFLNIPSSDHLPDLKNEFIGSLVVLFKNEIAQSFSKHKPYLQALNDHFNKKA